MARIVGLLLMMGAVCVGTYANATPPCEQQYEPEPGPLDLSYTIPPDQEVICGVSAGESRNLQLFEVVDWPNAGRGSDMEEAYWIDDGSGFLLWRPDVYESHKWPVRSAAAVKNVQIERVADPVPAANPAGCIALPRVDTQHPHVLALELEQDPDVHPVLARIEFDTDAPPPPPPPKIERVTGESLPNACKAHGLFVVEIGDESDVPPLYVWNIRDETGDVVQTGIGHRPHALAYPSENEGRFQHHGGQAVQATRKPFISGQTYEFRLRRIGKNGRHSDAATAQFTFEQTGEGVSYAGCAVFTIIVLLGAAGGLLIVLYWLAKAVFGRGRKDGGDQYV